MKLTRLIRHRDLLILIGLTALLIGFTAFSVVQQQRAIDSNVSFASYSAAPTGAQGLYDWLNALGYRTERLDVTPLDYSRAQVLIVLPGETDFSLQDAHRVLDWVSQGNILIYGDDTPFNRTALSKLLDVDVEYSPYNRLGVVTQPFLSDMSQTLTMNGNAQLSPNRNDYVIHLVSQSDSDHTDNQAPVLISFRQGLGRVFMTSAPDLFTNYRLADAGTAALVRGLFGTVPKQSVVLFDEAHRQNPNATESSLLNLIYTTPWGRGLLLAGLVCFAYLALNGRRFGRVMPLPAEITRRSPAEYAVSLADLFRRANKQTAVLEHYRQQLKRRLARPFGLDATLPDDEFVGLLRQMRPDLDAGALTQTLRALHVPAGGRVSEAQLVQLAAEASKAFIKA